MEDKLVSFETAVIAYSRGFLGKCQETYMFDLGELYNPNKHVNYDGLHIQAPTQSLLQRWLREKHNIIVLVDDNNWLRHMPEYWVVTVKNPTTELHVWDCGGRHATYEDALERGLQEGLKLIND